jgi:hypothetical protein
VTFSEYSNILCEKALNKEGIKEIKQQKQKERARQEG